MAPPDQKEKSTHPTSQEDIHSKPRSPPPAPTQSKFNTLHRPYALSDRELEVGTAKDSYHRTASQASSGPMQTAGSAHYDPTQPTGSTPHSPQMEKWLRQGVREEPYHTLAAVQAVQDDPPRSSAAHTPPSDATVDRGSFGFDERY